MPTSHPHIHRHTPAPTHRDIHIHRRAHHVHMHRLREKKRGVYNWYLFSIFLVKSFSALRCRDGGRNNGPGHVSVRQDMSAFVYQ